MGLLAFVGVTLLGHEDADFFAKGAATQLPLVGITVPVEAFFLTAPVLVDFLVDVQIPSNLAGYPVVGDFNGDMSDDLATWTDDILREWA